MGFRPGIAAFTAAVLGGIGSIGGAALGGFVIGLLQARRARRCSSRGSASRARTRCRDVFVFLVLVLVLVFRPGGLLGSRRGGEGLMARAGGPHRERSRGIVTIFLALVGLIGNFTDAEPDRRGGHVRRSLMLVLPRLRGGVRGRPPRVEAGEIVEMRAPEAAVARGGGRRDGRGGVRASRCLVDMFGVERIRAVFLNVSPS